MTTRTHRMILAILSLMPCGEMVLAAPITNAFSYQGQLKRDGTPVNDPVDLRFTIWEAPTGGTAHPTTPTFLAVPVLNGLFTVEPDFGFNTFDLTAKWLGVEVRHPAGVGGFVPLGSRHPIRAVPYARTALNVPWGIDGNDIHMLFAGNVGIGTDTPQVKLSIFGNESTSLSTGALSLWSPGGTLGQYLTLDGNEINGWSHLHLNPDATTDILMAEGGGNVGVGTALPAVKLHVVGGTDASPTGGGFAVFGNTASTNIAIDNNEIMARNNGVVAPLFLNNNGGDIVCGGPIEIGLQVVTSTSGSAPIYRQATCPAGKKLLGGGCSSANQLIEESRPINETTWQCRWDDVGVEMTAYVVCANVK